MRVIRQPSAFAAVSELRSRMDEILRQLKETPVTLEKHNREVAVLEDPKRYAAVQEALRAAAGLMLDFEARRRGAPGKGRRLSPGEVEKLRAARFRIIARVLGKVS